MNTTDILFFIAGIAQVITLWVGIFRLGAIASELRRFNNKTENK